MLYMQLLSLTYNTLVPPFFTKIALDIPLSSHLLECKRNALEHLNIVRMKKKKNQCHTPVKIN